MKEDRVTRQGSRGNEGSEHEREAEKYKVARAAKTGMARLGNRTQSGEHFVHQGSKEPL
jgi:hypothetical protein